jgi:hypothetical protein
MNFPVWVSVFYIINRINGKQIRCRKGFLFFIGSKVYIAFPHIVHVLDLNTRILGTRIRHRFTTHYFANQFR